MTEPHFPGSRHRGATSIKRWLAALALMLGGLSVELAQPVQCLLIATTRARGLRPDDA
jgi:hypothetical protein